MGEYIVDKGDFVFFHTPKCKKCGVKLHMARFPFVLSPETHELKRLAIQGGCSYGTRFYVLYYRCPSCKSVASVLDCYYAAHPRKLEEKQRLGKNYRLEDMFYVGLNERLRQKENGVFIPEPTEKDTEKNWLPFVRGFILWGYCMFALAGGAALFLVAKLFGLL